MSAGRTCIALERLRACLAEVEHANQRFAEQSQHIAAQCSNLPDLYGESRGAMVLDAIQEIAAAAEEMAAQAEALQQTLSFCRNGRHVMPEPGGVTPAFPDYAPSK